MYHYNLRISIFSLQQDQIAWLQEIPPLKGFEHTYAIDPELTAENIAASDIIVWAKPVQQEELLFLAQRKKKDALFVLLAYREELNNADAWVEVADDMWPRSISKTVLQRLFERLLRHYKTYCDSKLTESYLSALIDHMPDMVWFKDLQGIHMKVNDKFCEVVGKTKDDVQGRDHCYIWNIEPEEYAAGEYVCMETEAPVIEQGKSFMFEEKVKFGDGIHYLNTYKSPIFDLNHKVIGTVGYARDITDLWDEGTELRFILNYLPMPIMVTDTHDIIKVVNNSFCKMFDTRAEVVEGTHAEQLREGERGHSFNIVKWQQEEKELKLLFNYINNRGEELTFRAERKVLRNIEGRPIGYVYSFDNLVEERKASAANYKNSITDELTGAFNRRHYRVMVEEYVRRGQRFTVAELDCNDLKYVNDNYGHSMGDDYLLTVVNTLKSYMTHGESLCRIGGDEFVLLSIDRTQPQMISMLTEVNDKLAGLGLQYPAGISFGAERVDRVSFDEYRKGIHYADQQLYNMKRVKNVGIHR